MNDLCPNCRTLRELRMEIIEKMEYKKRTIIKNYYCDECNFFVKSEEIEIPEGKDGGIK